MASSKPLTLPTLPLLDKKLDSFHLEFPLLFLLFHEGFQYLPFGLENDPRNQDEDDFAAARLLGTGFIFL